MNSLTIPQKVERILSPLNHELGGDAEDEQDSGWGHALGDNPRVRRTSTKCPTRRIDKCQTISQLGSYNLVKNLSAPSGGSCLLLTTGRITIDLAGFSITGTLSQSTNNGGIIAAPPGGPDVAVRNGTISGFNAAVQLLGGSIVEGLRIFCGPGSAGINAQGIVRDNTVSECQPGITADQGSIITGNTVIGGIRGDGIVVNQGSTVIGNSVINNSVGIDANCPSNLTDNTVLNNPSGNIVLNGTGCNNTNNVAP